jgi:hypothetical protein
MSAWTDLADRLRSRYPDDWAQRYQSYKDGSNQDVQRWRNIGGERYERPAERPKARTGPKPGFTAAPDPALLARNKRIRDAARAGVPLVLLIERFGLSDSTIAAVLARFGERVQR